MFFNPLSMEFSRQNKIQKLCENQLLKLLMESPSSYQYTTGDDKLFSKVNILGFAGHTVSVTVTPLQFSGIKE